MDARTSTARRVIILALALGLAAALGTSGCAAPAEKPAAPPATAEDSDAPQSVPITQLQVYADESLEEVLTQTKPAFERLEGLQLVLTFGPSGELRTAIEEGAAADALVSADPGHVAGLVEAGLVEESAGQDVATGEGGARYVAAPLKGAEHRALGSIYALYLRSPQAQQAFKDAGFGPPPAK